MSRNSTIFLETNPELHTHAVRMWQAIKIDKTKNKEDQVKVALAIGRFTQVESVFVKFETSYIEIHGLRCTSNVASDDHGEKVDHPTCKVVVERCENTLLWKGDGDVPSGETNVQLHDSSENAPSGVHGPVRADSRVSLEPR